MVFLPLEFLESYMFYFRYGSEPDLPMRRCLAWPAWPSNLSCLVQLRRRRHIFLHMRIWLIFIFQCADIDFSFRRECFISSAVEHGTKRSSWAAWGPRRALKPGASCGRRQQCQLLFSPLRLLSYSVPQPASYSWPRRKTAILVHGDVDIVSLKQVAAGARLFISKDRGLLACEAMLVGRMVLVVLGDGHRPRIIV